MDNLNSSAFPQKIWCSPIVYQLSHSPFVAFKSSPLVPHCRSNLDSGHTSAASLLPPLWSSQFPYTTIPSITFIRNRQHPGPLHLSPSMFQLVSKSSWGCLIPSSWIWVLYYLHCHWVSLGTQSLWIITVALWMTRLLASTSFPFCPSSTLLPGDLPKIQIWLNLPKIIQRLPTTSRIKRQLPQTKGPYGLAPTYASLVLSRLSFLPFSAFLFLLTRLPFPDFLVKQTQTNITQNTSSDIMSWVEYSQTPSNRTGQSLW